MNEQEKIQEWASQNPWFTQNEALKTAAIGIEGHLAAQGVPLEQRLQHTTKMLAAGLNGPEYQDAQRAYQEIVRVDRKFGEKFSEDEYIAAALAPR